ncbi:hypothetical protein [Pseudomonas gingeri]|uniref:Uncharacterized protein n=1 Tax=Pseudomonas gingeri TaxID=117681 RepID=A0A7Y7Y8Q0_9PSED|nr:hypothetical protein [Pseudomonas gingeri]NWB29771.1 hypothetical protein [Pseudomonas gingeri]NWC31907.1 hypothetical protein [Pseudomonas gingeri]
MNDLRDPDLDDAIAELGNVLETLEQRAEASERALGKLARQRKAYLSQVTYDLLPKLSSVVLARLREQVPGFVTLQVQESFDTQRKFLGLFASKDYAHTLALLQTRLASHLDQLQHAGLRERNDEIAQVSAQREGLQFQRQATGELLALLQQARRQGTPLPPQVQEQVRHLATLARAARRNDDRTDFMDRDYRDYSSRHANDPSRTTVDERGPEQRDNPLDLLIYWATDMSTSLRTLVIDTVEGARREVDEVRREFSSEPNESRAATESGAAGSSQSSSAADSLVPAAVAVGVTAAAVTGAVIATDDSLGLFS